MPARGDSTAVTCGVAQKRARTGPSCRLVCEAQTQTAVRSSQRPEKGVVVSTQILLVGDSGVGKSSILQRFVSGTFQDQQPTTIGARRHAQWHRYAHVTHTHTRTHAHAHMRYTDTDTHLHRPAVCVLCSASHAAGVDFSAFHMDIHDKRVKLMIWDTAGKGWHTHTHTHTHTHDSIQRARVPHAAPFMCL